MKKEILKKPIPQAFFQGADTAFLAQSLLGKVLSTEFNGQLTAGKITEVEAYLGASDRACHAFDYRRTARTETMFLPGGHTYIYLCYGIHHLFNVVTHQQNEPHAILIRAVEPVLGIEIMMERRKMAKVKPSLSAGPGSMSQALGITTAHNQMKINEGPIRIEDWGFRVKKSEIVAKNRIGVDYAGEHASWALRFFLKDNDFVSRK